MRVIQTYVTWGRDPFWDKKLAQDVDKLASSAIQWKFVFPNDSMHLYLGPKEYNYVLKTFSTSELETWDSISYLTQTGSEYKKFSKMPYTGARFWSLFQQAEPALFIDPDVFVWPEFQNCGTYRQWVQDVEQGKKAVIFDYSTCWGRDVSPDLFNLIESMLGMGRLSEEFHKGVATNTGMLGYHPILRNCLSKIMKCQELFFNSRVKEKDPKLLEVTDGCIIVEAVKQLKIKQYFFDSDYLIHWLVGYPRVPAFMRDTFTEEPPLSQVKIAWEQTLTGIRKTGKGVTSKEFQKTFETALQLKGDSTTSLV